jgi:hypothetical protein
MKTLILSTDARNPDTAQAKVATTDRINELGQPPRWPFSRPWILTATVANSRLLEQVTHRDHKVRRPGSELGVDWQK